MIIDCKHILSYYPQNCKRHIRAFHTPLSSAFKRASQISPLFFRAAAPFVQKVFRLKRRSAKRKNEAAQEAHPPLRGFVCMASFHIKTHRQMPYLHSSFQQYILRTDMPISIYRRSRFASALIRRQAHCPCSKEHPAPLRLFYKTDDSEKIISSIRRHDL